MTKHNGQRLPKGTSNLGLQLSWESACLARRRSAVRSRIAPPLLLREKQLVERQYQYIYKFSSQEPKFIYVFYCKDEISSSLTTWIYLNTNNSIISQPKSLIRIRMQGAFPFSLGICYKSQSHSQVRRVFLVKSQCGEMCTAPSFQLEAWVYRDVNCTVDMMSIDTMINSTNSSSKLFVYALIGLQPINVQ